MRIKARALGLHAEDYFNDKVLEDTDLLYTGTLRAAGRLLGQPRQGHGILEAGRPHLLPRQRAAGAATAGQRVRLPGQARQPLYGHGRARSAGKTRCCETLQRLHPPEERRLGHHRAQPRAELRAQPADGSGDRLRHPARPGRHRQDAADAGRRPDPDAGNQALHRDHHDPRHGAGRRGHRLPARHRRRKDGAVDGRARGQPRGAQHRRDDGRPATGAAPPPTT